MKVEHTHPEFETCDECQARLSHGRGADAETETCPTCWQPVPVPQRGDHDYGIPLSVPAPTLPALDALRGLSEKATPGPLRVVWPSEQGGPFLAIGKQGTREADFTDGWAIPLFASGVDSNIEFIVALVNWFREEALRDAV